MQNNSGGSMNTKVRNQKHEVKGYTVKQKKIILL